MNFKYIDKSPFLEADWLIKIFFAELNGRKISYLLLPSTSPFTAFSYGFNFPCSKVDKGEVEKKKKKGDGFKPCKES